MENGKTMKTKLTPTIKVAVAMLLGFAMVFIALRVYGFYQNETRQALAKAAIADQQAAACLEEIQKATAKAACSNQWVEYRIQVLRGQHPQMPDCGEHFMYVTAPMFMKEAADLEIQLDKQRVCKVAAIGDAFEKEAVGWRAYAYDRKGQTKHFFRHMWYAIMGVKEPS
jgi:hypothetical protein